MIRSIIFKALVVIVLVLYAGGPAEAQTAFQSPEDAMKALIDAFRADDTQKVMVILGPEGKDLVYSGDEVADKNNNSKTVQEYQEKVRFVKEKDRVLVIIGNDDYPMAVPLVKKDEGWVFDTPAGRQELLHRRIGRNELAAIKVCQEYVQAQTDYFSADRILNGVRQYAQKFRSDPGKRDGLYWEAPETEVSSPFGSLVATAAGEGYVLNTVCAVSPDPYHGYIYKILTAQGSDAPGGAYSYVINGNMTAGFALIAWPAEYGISGVMTFIVNQNGIVYEKDLGTRTNEIAKATTEYNPGDEWGRAH